MAQEVADKRLEDNLSDGFLPLFSLSLTCLCSHGTRGKEQDEFLAHDPTLTPCIIQ